MFACSERERKKTHLCDIFEFEVKYLSLLILPTNHTLASSVVKHHITLMQMSCCGCDAWDWVQYLRENMHAIQAITTRVDLLNTNITPYEWSGRQGITVGCGERAQRPQVLYSE